MVLFQLGICILGYIYLLSALMISGFPYQLSFSLKFMIRLIFCCVVVYGCENHLSFPSKELIALSDESKIKPRGVWEEALEQALAKGEKYSDSIQLKNVRLVKEIYLQNNHSPLWSSNGSFLKETDSLLYLIHQAFSSGLFPADYNEQRITQLKVSLQKSVGTNEKPDVVRWSQFDMLATSVFIQLVMDIKVGRLIPDSVLAKDPALIPAFFLEQKKQLAAGTVQSFIKNLEPSIPDFHQLKNALKNFLLKANLKRYTQIKATDSLLLPGLVYRRICEEDSLKIKPVKKPDSTTISAVITKYQKRKGLKADGKISKALVSRLNATDREKFIRIAITLDKYKMLPSVPKEYLWVNLPGFFMELRDGDSVRLKSKIICGKAETKTPQITSAITDMITYPQWTIPDGIIKKEILPGLQRNPGYTRSKGYSIVDQKGNEVNPYSVNWSKYKKGIPYKVVQGNGDANALGIMKFNFSNPYAVYLHDTNQRYLFKNAARALSHGCVRVQQWKELAYYLLRRDNLIDSSKTIRVDSLNRLLALKKKRMISIQQPLPLFIRYFSCEGKDGKLIIHEDMYEEDKRIRETVFASK